MIICECAQRSDEWFRLKAGVVGASSLSKIITTKGEPSKQRTDYMYELAGEKIIGRCEETYTSFAMEQGIAKEDEARSLYELITGIEVQRVGFIFRDESRSCGCSPDGLFNPSGIEIKCPMLKTHVKYLLDSKLPTDYFAQVHGSMWVCGAESWTFMSYVPAMPPLILTIDRDYKFTRALDQVMADFVGKLNEVHKKLLERVA